MFSKKCIYENSKLRLYLIGRKMKEKNRKFYKCFDFYLTKFQIFLNFSFFSFYFPPYQVKGECIIPMTVRLCKLSLIFTFSFPQSENQNKEKQIYPFLLWGFKQAYMQLKFREKLDVKWQNRLDILLGFAWWFDTVKIVIMRELAFGVPTAFSPWHFFSFFNTFTLISHPTPI